MTKQQARHFTVRAQGGARPFDGARQATVTIQPVGTGGDRWNLIVRPHRRRQTIEVSLAQVVERLIWQDAKDRARRRAR